jgi:predicted DNA-binding protein with PD1-like motif
MTDFSTPQPISLRVQLPAGQVDLTASPTDTTTVDLRPAEDDNELGWQVVEETTVELRGNELVIEVPERGRGWLLKRTPELILRVQLPLDSTVRAGVASADLRCVGRLAEARVNTASGDVDLEEVSGDVDIKSASGDIQLRRGNSAVRISSASGDIELGEIGGDVQVNVASGDIVVQEAQGSVRARTASGDVRVARARSGEVQVDTASGDVHVGVAAGTGVYLDLTSMSGDTTTDLDIKGEAPTDTDNEMRLRVRTMSGDIAVVRA